MTGTMWITLVGYTLCWTMSMVIASWSEWSDWSGCSRTCGGGASYQLRRCESSRDDDQEGGCVGANIRYRTCSNQSCEGVPGDFRNKQCAAYDDIEYRGTTHQWEAYIESRDPCSLRCRSKNAGFVVMLAPQVLDGTRCLPNKRHMCINGSCKRVGCDFRLGSKLSRDRCGVCGGNGSSCSQNTSDTEQDSFTWRETAFSACSVSCGVGERRTHVNCYVMPTGEHVAEKYCNATTRPSHRIAPCNNTECPRLLPVWITSRWQSCSRTCGGGFMWRNTYCVTEAKDGRFRRMRDERCHMPKPITVQRCNIEDCPQWIAGSWSMCSVSCGKGIQMRAIICKRTKLHRTCEISVKPTLLKKCNTGILCRQKTNDAMLAHEAFEDSPRHDPQANLNDNSGRQQPSSPESHPNENQTTNESFVASAPDYWQFPSELENSSDESVTRTELVAATDTDYYEDESQTINESWLESNGTDHLKVVNQSTNDSLLDVPSDMDYGTELVHTEREAIVTDDSWLVYYTGSDSSQDLDDGDDQVSDYFWLDPDTRGEHGHDLVDMEAETLLNNDSWLGPLFRKEDGSDFPFYDEGTLSYEDLLLAPKREVVNPPGESLFHNDSVIGQHTDVVDDDDDIFHEDQGIISEERSILNPPSDSDDSQDFAYDSDLYDNTDSTFNELSSEYDEYGDVYNYVDPEDQFWEDYFQLDHPEEGKSEPTLISLVIDDPDSTTNKPPTTDEQTIFSTTGVTLSPRKHFIVDGQPQEDTSEIGYAELDGVVEATISQKPNAYGGNGNEPSSENMVQAIPGQPEGTLHPRIRFEEAPQVVLDYEDYADPVLIEDPEEGDMLPAQQSPNGMFGWEELREGHSHNMVSTTPRFVASAWGPCSVSCGMGMRTRHISCKVYLPATGEVHDVDEIECTGPRLLSSITCEGDSRCDGSEDLIHRNPPPHRRHLYSWRFAGYGLCNAICAGGMQEPSLECTRTFGDWHRTRVSSDMCTDIPRPRIRPRRCNESPCPPRWRVGVYGDCSRSCGSGDQIRQVHCIQELGEGSENVVVMPEHVCWLPVPKRIRPCKLQPCPARWQAGEWLPCSVSCGEGVQHREVRCEEVHIQDTKVTLHEDSLCLTSNPHKPEGTKSCQIPACPILSLPFAPVIRADRSKYVQLKPCSRLFLNVGGEALVIPGTFLSIRCPARRMLEKDIRWRKGDGEVPMRGRVRQNGKGMLMIRGSRGTDAGLYTCSLGNHNASLQLSFHTESQAQAEFMRRMPSMVDNEFINKFNALRHPRKLRGRDEYSLHFMLKKFAPEDIPFEFVPSEWTPCSQSCGGDGLKSREIRCEVILDSYYLVVADQYCDDRGYLKPSETSDCGSDPCPHWQIEPWGNCNSEVCMDRGVGSSRRAVECVSVTGEQVSRSQCDISSTPVHIQPCEHLSCVAVWQPSNWTKCLPECGGRGKMSRSLQCVWAANNSPAGSMCRGLPRPAAVLKCNTSQCQKVCRDKSSYCSLAPILKMCRFPQYQAKCCSSCARGPRWKYRNQYMLKLLL